MATESTGSGHGRAVRGIEAAAWVLGHAVEAYAIVGGEGARRLAVALAQSGDGGPAKLEGEGLTAAQAATGHAAAGKRTALIASGDALIEALPALREMARLGLPVLVVVPSHGADTGQSLPSQGFQDIQHLLSLPIGVLLAADASQIGDFLLAGLRAANDRGAPWVVGFELATAGLALANARLPDEEQIRAWAKPARAPAANTVALAEADVDLDRYKRDIERFEFAIGAAMRETERVTRRAVAPVIADGLSEADLVIVSAGSSARSARHALPHMHARIGRHVGVLQVASFRPFPAADIVRHAWRARAVIVHEPFAQPLGTGGSLSDSVRASFADALTWHPGFAGIGRIPPVVTVLGRDVSPEQWLSIARTVADAPDPPRLLAAPAAGRNGGSAEACIEIAMDEAEREQALKLVVEWLARAGSTVAAHANEPTRSSITVARAGESKGPTHVLVVCPGGAFESTRLESLPAGALVVLAGDFPDRVLAETMRAGAARGIRVATLHGSGVPLTGNAAIAAVVRTMVAPTAALDAAFESAARDIGGNDADGLVQQVRVLADALRAQFS